MKKTVPHSSFTINLPARILLIAVCAWSSFILRAQLPSPEKVKKDFIALLQRPSVDPKPSFTSFTTDSVLIERGFFYTDQYNRASHLPKQCRSSFSFIYQDT